MTAGTAFFSHYTPAHGSEYCCPWPNTTSSLTEYIFSGVAGAGQGLSSEHMGLGHVHQRSRPLALRACQARTGLICHWKTKSCAPLEAGRLWQLSALTAMERMQPWPWRTMRRKRKKWLTYRALVHGVQVQQAAPRPSGPQPNFYF